MKLLLALLLSLSLLLPVSAVHSQGPPYPPVYCFYLDVDAKPYAQWGSKNSLNGNYRCNVGDDFAPYSTPNPFYGICWQYRKDASDNTYDYDVKNATGQKNGNVVCDQDYIGIAPGSIRPAGSGGGGGSGGSPTPTPKGTPTPGTTPKPTATPVGGGGTGGGSGSGGGTGGNPAPPNQGECEIGFAMQGPLCVPQSPGGSGGNLDITALLVKIVEILLYFAGIVAVIMAIIGGYFIMTAAGNATQAANGRKTLINAIIGLAVVVLSYTIIQAVLSFVTSKI